MVRCSLRERSVRVPHDGDRVPTDLDHSADLSTGRQLAAVLTERGGAGLAEVIGAADARAALPDLEATRAIRQGDLEARLLQQVLLESCRLPEGRPLADDDATRMVRADGVDEDTTSAAHGAVAPGDEETTEQDATTPVDDDATLWTAVGPVDDADPVTAPRGPTFPAASEPAGPAPVAPASPRPPPRAQSARVGVRPRHSSMPAPNQAPVARPGTGLPSVSAGARPQPPQVSRRHRRRKLFVALLMGGLFVALFWIAATAPTGASSSPPSSPPRQTR
jgi:hypothetical protein